MYLFSFIDIKGVQNLSKSELGGRRLVTKFFFLKVKKKTDNFISLKFNALYFMTVLRSKQKIFKEMEIAVN